VADLETTKDIQIGQFVRSKAGRDKDRIFIVMNIADEKYVLIADGDLRRIEKPKKKKIRHLAVMAQVSTSLKDKLSGDGKINNAFVRREIEKLGLN
jgi:ribosomal protein L14E/L6E/L27E